MDMECSAQSLAPMLRTEEKRTSDSPLVTISSRVLLGQANVVQIEHEGMLYTLRATRNGKLILTK